VIVLVVVALRSLEYVQMSTSVWKAQTTLHLFKPHNRSSRTYSPSQKKS